MFSQKSIFPLALHTKSHSLLSWFSQQFKKIRKLRSIHIRTIDNGSHSLLSCLIFLHDWNGHKMFVHNVYRELQQACSRHQLHTMIIEMSSRFTCTIFRLPDHSNIDYCNYYTTKSVRIKKKYRTKRVFFNLKIITITWLFQTFSQNMFHFSLTFCKEIGHLWVHWTLLFISKCKRQTHGLLPSVLPAYCRIKKWDPHKAVTARGRDMPAGITTIMLCKL